MHTKPRHVDINRLWMKQEVNAGRIHVVCIPTGEIPRSAWDERNPTSDYTQ